MKRLLQGRDDDSLNAIRMKKRGPLFVIAPACAWPCTVHQTRIRNQALGSFMANSSFSLWCGRRPLCATPQSTLSLSLYATLNCVDRDWIP